jgi:hypothetical protein
LSQYQRLASGEVPDRDKDSLLGHLEACDRCAQMLASLPEPDTLVSLLRQPQTLGEEGPDEPVVRLVEQLSKLRPGDEPAAEATHAWQDAPDRSLYDFLAPPRAADEQGRPGPGFARRGIGRVPRPKAQALDELGRLGPYRVLRVLGAGGMGIVFLAEDMQLQRQVALKAMRPVLAVSKSARERFLREARAAAAIKHDHIVTVYQVGEDRGIPFLAMELLEGESLDARLGREGKLPVAEVLRLGLEMALGLAAAHRHGLIHRDITPANVWLEALPGERGASAPRPRAKILDFGLARATAEDGRLTQQGVVLGTPAYMAPEQGQGRAVDERSDLFSLGCVLYRMATGTAPFAGADVISTLLAVASEDPRPPHEVEPALPAALSALIMELLAKDPAARPASAQAVGETLKAIACPPARSEQPARVGRRAAWRLAVAGGALLLALPALAYWLSGFVVRVETDQGTLIIKTDDDKVEVKVTDHGGATLTYGPDRRVIRLKPGRYGIELADAKAGLKLSTDHFSLAAGGTRTVEVRWEKKAPAPVVKKQPAGPVEKALAPPADRLRPGSVWVGKRTYRKGWYAGSTVTYELHVRRRDGTKFAGHIFDNGPGRNRAEVQGQVQGDILTWREQGRFPDLHINVRGRLTGDTIRLTIQGERVDGSTYLEGDGELTLRQPPLMPPAPADALRRERIEARGMAAAGGGDPSRAPAGPAPPPSETAGAGRPFSSRT